MHRNFFITIVTVAALTQAPGLCGQQPPPKPPAFPAINPAAAKLAVVLNGLDGPGSAIAYSEDTGIIAAACEHGIIRCWTKDMTLGLRSGDGTPFVLEGHRGPITAMVWQHDVLASTAADRKLLLWQMPEGKLLHTITLDGVSRALALSPDGKTLASGSDQGAIQLWDVATGKPTVKLEGHTDWLLCLAFSPDGKQLASGGQDATVKTWDLATGKKKLDIPATPAAQPKSPPPTTNYVHAVVFSPDSTQLAFGGTDAQIYLASAVDGKIIRPMTGHTGSISSLAFHPSGTLLVSGSKDRTVRLWNPTNGQAIKTLEGHQSWVQGVVLTALGTRIASVSADQTVRVWDMAEPPKK